MVKRFILRKTGNEYVQKLEDNIKSKDAEIEVATHNRKKKKGAKKENLEGLGSTNIDCYLSEEEAKCPQCDNPRHIIGKSERLELRIIPAKVEVVKYIIYAYGCRQCEKNDIKVPIEKSKAPKPVIAKSIASPSVITHIMANKFLNGLPLYRQEQEFKRYGVEISRQNMANWVLYGTLFQLKIYKLKQII